MRTRSVIMWGMGVSLLFVSGAAIANHYTSDADRFFELHCTRTRQVSFFAFLCDLRERIDAVHATPGPAGPQGEQGPRGGTGSLGLQGIMGPRGGTGAVGLQGPMGPQGGTGAVGLRGEQGTAGIQGVSGWEKVTASATGSGGSLTATAACSSGKKIVGGGFSTTGAPASITMNASNADGTQWLVTDEQASTRTLTSYAYCATVN